jgi:hypothetical protein
MDRSGGGNIRSCNIPKSAWRFNVTAEKAYSADYEFNGLRLGSEWKVTQKLFIGSNSFSGTTIAVL